jgi:hypothetical protein
MKSIEPFSTWSVTGAFLGSPLAVKALLNQIVLPARMAAPLKLPVIDDTVDGTVRSSNWRTAGRTRLSVRDRR